MVDPSAILSHTVAQTKQNVELLMRCHLITEADGRDILAKLSSASVTKSIASLTDKASRLSVSDMMPAGPPSHKGSGPPGPPHYDAPLHGLPHYSGPLSGPPLSGPPLSGPPLSGLPHYSAPPALPPSSSPYHGLPPPGPPGHYGPPHGTQHYYEPHHSPPLHLHGSGSGHDNYGYHDPPHGHHGPPHGHHSPPKRHGSPPSPKHHSYRKSRSRSPKPAYKTGKRMTESAASGFGFGAGSSVGSSFGHLL